MIWLYILIGVVSFCLGVVVAVIVMVMNPYLGIMLPPYARKEPDWKEYHEEERLIDAD